MSQKPNKPWDAKIAYYFVLPLAKTSITPNHITTLRLIFGCLAFIGIATGDYLWSNIGACCFVTSNLLDHADGELARLTGKSSQWGHYYDLCCDLLIHIGLFIGLGIGLYHAGGKAYIIVAAIIAGISVATIFYTHNELERLGGKSQAKLPSAFGFEIEDILYLFPIVTLLQSQFIFLVAATIGAPLFSIWILVQYYRMKRHIV